jgi:hypothetical protein
MPVFAAVVTYDVVRQQGKDVVRRSAQRYVRALA